MSDSRQDRQDKKAGKFLSQLAIHGIVGKAARAAGLGRATVYEWRKDDESFAKAWDDAVESGIERIEREALRRAVEGVDKPVYQQGAMVGTIREFSDTLLIFLLKAKRPRVYRDNVSHEHSGPNGDPIAVTGVLRIPSAKTEAEWDAERIRATGMSVSTTALPEPPKKAGS